MYMLTTVDNPYNPATQFDEWNTWDQTKGYHTLSLMARIARTSEELSDAINNYEIDKAINEIIKFDVLGVYKRVHVEDTDLAA